MAEGELSTIEHVEIPKQCSICNESFLTKKQWEEHKKDIHLKDELKYDLAKYVKDIHKAVSLEIKCIKCGKTYATDIKLKNHQVRCFSPNTLQCEICYKTLSCKATLDVHKRRKHFTSRNFPCEDCSKKFFSLSDVKTHAIQVHSDYRPFSCNMCPAKFKRNAGWNQHKKTHINNKNFECPICQKLFKNKMSVDRCLNIHQNSDQKYQCALKECDQILSSKGAFKRHVQTHQPKERLSCNVCTKTLCGRSELSRHMKRVHVNIEKTFQCTICSVRTYSSAELSRHMLIHSGDVFTCPAEGCQSKSNTQYGINFHYKKKHGQVKHRRSIEDINKDQNRKLDCDLCDTKIRAGRSAVYNMKMHMETHRKKVRINCPIKDCPKKICDIRDKKRYNLPVKFYNHLEKNHEISFQEYKIQVSFECKICDEKLLLKTIKPPTSALNFAESYAPRWGEKLKEHIKVIHNMEEIRGWPGNWDQVFRRKEVTLEKIVPPTFIERLLETKKCAMDCDFQVTDKYPSVWRKKLLKHYCTRHFGPKLLEMEKRFFKINETRNPKCLYCDFMIKQRNVAQKIEAVHIGVEHGEIIKILKLHFQKSF